MISVENKDIRKADKLAAAVDRMVQDSSLSRRFRRRSLTRLSKKMKRPPHWQSSITYLSER